MLSIVTKGQNSTHTSVWYSSRKTLVRYVERIIELVPSPVCTSKVVDNQVRKVQPSPADEKSDSITIVSFLDHHPLERALSNLLLIVPLVFAQLYRFPRA